MQFIRKLPEAKEIIEQYPLSDVQIKNRQKRIIDIQMILSGKDRRKILLIGPCSADREDAVLDYVSRLAKLQEQVQDRFLIIPRVYTSKPRTDGMGYKGLLHRQSSDAKQDNLIEGIIAIRKLHLHIIQETNMYCVDEMLYPESIYYILDLLAYVAVGARSVENQGHRLAASGLQLPVGMKNPTSGDISVLLNSILAAQHAQSLMYRGWEVRTNGNVYAHAILRGYVDMSGKSNPNYYYENLCELYDRYRKTNLKNISVIIDCNHSNSNKNYDEQIRIAEEVIGYCRRNTTLNQFVKGLMIESYIEDGSQLIGDGIYGKSVTDGCLGWKKTEKMIYDLN